MFKLSRLIVLLFFLFPWLIGLFVFLLGPIATSFYFSFTDYDILRKPIWIGLDNYMLMFSDPVFWKSLQVTFVYAIITLPLSVIFGIALAILLNQKIPGISLYRTFIYLPSIIPLVASSIIWLWIFRGDEGGLLNNILSKVYIKGPLWFSDPTWSLIALIIMSLWSVGNSVLIYLAGLQSIPQSLYEASEIDGANFWQKLFLITIPMLTPTIFFNLVISIISVFQYFVPAYVMTSGGPQYATTFYSLYTYQNAFEDFKLGYASAMAWILFVVVVFFTWLAFKGFAGKVFYHGFIFLLLLLIFHALPLTVKAQENLQQQIAVKTTNRLSYNLQRYTGFNFLADFIAEGIIKILMKLKTNAKEVNVDLQIYSGFDLVKKKAKSLSLKASDLFIKNVPIKYFELITESPLYFAKNSKKKNQAAIPVDLAAKLNISLEDVSHVLGTLPKWKEVFEEIDLPVPPFGSTKIALNDLKIKINETGYIQIACIVTSVVNPSSEPLVMRFNGNLSLRNNRIVINNLKCGIEDIFTSDSDIGKSFSEMLEDLINPVFDFHKYEKRGLRIVNVDLSFGLNEMFLKINIRLLPEKGWK